jgi:thioredoxin-related protein
MNKFLFIIAVSICFVGVSQNKTVSKLNWIESFSDAKSIALKENKPMLILFTGSDWCKYCKNLTADFFNSDKFKEIAQTDFVLYKADFPRNKSLVTENQKRDNLELKDKFGVNLYPTIYITNSKGKSIDNIKGYSSARDTKYHYMFIESALNKNNKKSTK